MSWTLFWTVIKIPLYVDILCFTGFLLWVYSWLCGFMSVLPHLNCKCLLLRAVPCSKRQNINNHY